MRSERQAQRQAQFRADFRSRIADWYNGWVHVFVIYLIGFGGLYYFISNISNVVWWEWLTIPVVAFIGNLFEWFLHRHVMHRPWKNTLLRAIYDRHTLAHHQFFTEEQMTIDSEKDFRVTFFPPYALCVFMIISAPAALALGWLLSPNVGWLLMCTSTGTYILYEAFHFSCHVHDNWFVRNCPFVNTIRRHHEAHHNQSIMMERNMNLTFPISDWLFGTSDLNRGLIGHLFNGYDKSHVRKDLRKTSRTPKVKKRNNADAAAGA
jgi:hypothetical protein